MLNIAKTQSVNNLRESAELDRGYTPLWSFSFLLFCLGNFNYTNFCILSCCVIFIKVRIFRALMKCDKFILCDCWYLPLNKYSQYKQCLSVCLHACVHVCMCVSVCVCVCVCVCILPYWSKFLVFLFNHLSTSFLFGCSGLVTLEHLLKTKKNC